MKSTVTKEFITKIDRILKNKTADELEEILENLEGHADRKNAKVKTTLPNIGVSACALNEDAKSVDWLRDLISSGKYNIFIISPSAVYQDEFERTLIKRGMTEEELSKIIFVNDKCEYSYRICPNVYVYQGKLPTLATIESAVTVK